MSRAASEAHSLAPLCSWSLRDFFGVANAAEPAHCPAVTRKVRLVWRAPPSTGLCGPGDSGRPSLQPSSLPEVLSGKACDVRDLAKSGSHPILTLHLTEIICQSR